MFNSLSHESDCRHLSLYNKNTVKLRKKLLHSNQPQILNNYFVVLTMAIGTTLTVRFLTVFGIRFYSTIKEHLA